MRKVVAVVCIVGMCVGFSLPSKAGVIDIAVNIMMKLTGEGPTSETGGWEAMAVRCQVVTTDGRVLEGHRVGCFTGPYKSCSATGCKL